MRGKRSSNMAEGTPLPWGSVIIIPSYLVQTMVKGYTVLIRVEVPTVGNGSDGEG